MDNLLEFDLNELVSKNIADKIQALEQRVVELSSKNTSLLSEIEVLKNNAKDHKMAMGLFNFLREQFNKIEASEKDKSGYYKSKSQNQFLYIEQVMLNVFNVKKEAKGWYTSRDYGSLAPHLAVNFYSHKNILIDLLNILSPKLKNEIKFIEGFLMPYDYKKEDVIDYVKQPKYNTNGCIFGIHQYWIEAGAGKPNMPHDLIMKSPFILEADVFSTLLQTIKKQTVEYHYLFALPEHNSAITDKQIQLMGAELPNITKNVLSYEEVSNFISNNLKKFNNATLDYLYTLISADNQFKVLYWEKFPQEYQVRFLKSKTMDEVLKILTAYNCTWTAEQKESFLKEYTNK